MPKTPREIVLAAYNYLAEVIPPTQKISEARVEEIRPLVDTDAGFWKVVLSYDVGEFAFDKKREFKEFKVEDTTAKVIYMKPVEK